MATQPTNWMDRRYPNKAALIAALKNATEDTHDASEHRFTPDPAFPGNSCCAVCGWAHPDGPKFEQCGHTVRDHMLNFLASLDGKEGDTAFAAYPHGKRASISRLLNGYTIIGYIVDIEVTASRNPLTDFLKGLWPF